MVAQLPPKERKSKGGSCHLRYERVGVAAQLPPKERKSKGGSCHLRYERVGATLRLKINAYNCKAAGNSI